VKRLLSCRPRRESRSVAGSWTARVMVMVRVRVGVRVKVKWTAARHWPL